MEKFNAMRTRLLQHLQKKAIRSRSIMTLVCLLLASASAFAQAKTVTGTVTDAANEPLIGASVLVQGTSTGTITDMDGKYSISVTPEDVLAFSYVGMTSQTVKVGTQNVINVTLKEDSQVLAETVVIGYGSAKKRDLTGSITNVKGEELANKPAMNPLSSLQGKVAGVQIVNSGRAGSDPEIRIRGTNSINGYKPLYIVDGLFNDNINFLNPEDIESMEILKDPSSLAIFGVRGANGVIIITTKKAKEGQTLVNINTSFGFKKVVDKVKMVNGSQFKELYSEQLANQGDAPFDYTGWDANTDWQDEIFQTAFITNNNISITGASPKHSFYLGVGYSYEQGNIEHEKFSKVTINASNDYKITDFLKVGFQFNGARMLPADSKQVLNALRATPIAPVYNNEYGLYTALPEFQKAQINNPMVDVELKANTTKAENYRASGNIYGEVDFLKHFTFKAMFSMDYASNNGRTYTPIVKVYEMCIRDSFYSALYKAFLWPILLSDVNGEYVDAKGEVVNKGFRYYSEPSFWDDYRNKLILLGMVSPDVTADVIKSITDYGEIRGFMPRFFHGDHASVFVTGSYLRGIHDFDVQKAYKILLNNAFAEGKGSRPHIKEYMERGWISEMDIKDPKLETVAKAAVTKTQEYAYDDYATALLAKELGDMQNYEILMKRTDSYKHLFDPTTQQMRPRLENGEWVTPFDPKRPFYEYMYREANGWQSTFFALHDPQGLIDLFPSKEAFETKLDSLFTIPWEGYEAHNLTTFIGQYCHGNQPGHSIPYMYYFVDKQEKSQKILNKILNGYYRMGPEKLAYCGMDDAGEMSSWYVLNAIGLYTYSPADPKYIITVPLFDKTIFNLNGKDFTIKKKGNGEKITNITYDNEKVESFFITHDKLKEGKELIISVE